MRRVLDGQVIETQEEMAECGLHSGRWDNEGEFCVLHDEENYASYIEHVRVDSEVNEPWLREQRAYDAEQEARDTAGLPYVGLSPDAPVTANENGGLQSVVEGRFDLLPPVAMFELAKVMEHGATKYAPRNWMKISVDSHLNHALMHAFAFLAGDRQEDHLTHLLARAAMAVEIEKVGVQES